MAELIEAVLLGLLQGVVDPMPVSSSGHLVLLQHFFGIEQRLTLSVFLHFGNLLAIILVFRRDIKEIFSFNPRYPRLVKYIIIGILPVGTVGFLLKPFFDRVFATTIIVGFMLLVTGLVLFTSKYSANKGRDMEEMQLKDAIIVGLAQMLALFPGLSRSGMTIVSGLHSGLDRKLAVKYSFLMSVPVVLAATSLELIEVIQTGTGEVGVNMIITGTITAVISGFAAIKLLQHIVERQSLFFFAYYCWMLGSAILAIFL